MALVEGAVVALTGAGWFWLKYARARAAARAWRAAAEDAGFTHLEQAGFPGRFGRLIGQSGPLQVSLEKQFIDQHPFTRVEIRGLLSGLTLRQQWLNDDALSDTATGDPAFDREIVVRGPDAALRAILDEETRLLVYQLVSGRKWDFVDASVVDGQFCVVFSDQALAEARETLADGLRTMVGIAQRLVPPSDVPNQLARNARSERPHGVRLQNLLALIRHFPDHPATAETLGVARSDESEAVRLHAALALGSAARDLVREIALAEDGDDACAGRAVAALGAELSLALVLEILHRSLRRRRLHTAAACLGWLGRSDEDGAIEALLKVLAVEQGELALAAVHALGETTSAAVVLPLQQAAERHGRDSEMERAARKAIASVQSRLSGPPGALSLAEGEAGQLSLAEDPAGQLSLTPPKTPDGDG